MNIKEFRRLSKEAQVEELKSKGVFIEVYADSYKDIKTDKLREKIEVFSLYSFYVYAYRKRGGVYSVINIQGVIDYLEPESLQVWLRTNPYFHKYYITEVKSYETKRTKRRAKI